MSGGARVGVNLRASAFLHQGNRKYMEDECEVAYQRTANSKDIEYAYFGIFDGHGGKEASIYAKDCLMDHIVSQRCFWSDDDEEVLSAIREGFIQTHHAMWRVVDEWPKTTSGWPSTSGTTASIAFIRRHKIYIGHVGDSGIVLGYDDGGGSWIGESLTQDHKPESIQENTRITESGGKVIYKSGVPRVVWNRPKFGHKGPVRRSTSMVEIPFLAVARSLGDLWSYNADYNQFVVSPEPDVCVVDIDITRHRCLIFATDGLWNALSTQAAVNIAYAAEKNNEIHYLAAQYPKREQRRWINPSTSIVCGALEKYQRTGLKADNTSAITVYIDYPGKLKRDKLIARMKCDTSNKDCDTKVNRCAIRYYYRRKEQEDKREINEECCSPSSASTVETCDFDQPICDELLPSNSNDSRVELIQDQKVSSTSTTVLKDLSATPEIKEAIKRRTRSSISPIKEHDHICSTNVNSSLHTNFQVESPNSRVLKNVNRSSPTLVPQSSVKAGFTSNKRKRNVEKDGQECKRIATRSSGLRAKSMITRSQDKVRRQSRK